MAHIPFQFRRDTAANWSAENPVLREGELGFETDDLGTADPVIKIGDGVTAWNSLPAYAPAAAGVNVVSGTGIDVDNTDPINPIVALDTGTIFSLGLADTSVQPGDNISTLTNNSGYTTNTGTVTSVGASVPTGLSLAGSPVTTSGTLAITYTAGYAIPTTAKQTEWDTAYADRNKWDGGATGLTAATGRTSLGGTTVGQNVFTVTNPSAIRFFRVNADNSVDLLTDSAFRTAIGAGTSSTTGTVTSVDLASSTGLTPSGGPITSSGSLTYTLSANLQAWHGLATSAKQDADADLTTIAGLAASNDDFLQRKSGAWANRTVAQVKTDLGLSGTNSGDQTTIVGITGTLAEFNTALTGADFATGGGTATGTNTGDQTTIVGITGTLAEFNAALTGADFATGGGTATGTNTGDQTITLTGDVTGTGTGSFATTLATTQPAVHTWSLAQTFTVAPVFTDQSGTRTALGLGTAALSAATAFEPAVTAGTVAQFWLGDKTWSDGLVNTSGAMQLRLTAYGAATNFYGGRVNGTLGSETATLNNQQLAGLAGFGHDGSATTNNRARIRMQTTADWTGVSTPTQILFDTTSVGAIAPTNRWNILDTGHFVPGAANTYDVGTAALPLRAAYITTPAAATNTTAVATTAYAVSAAPNISYRNLFEREGSHTAARVVGTYAIPSGAACPISGTGTLAPWGVFYLDPADYPTINGLTTKLRVRGQIVVNDTAPAATFVIALHTVTHTGSTGAAGLNLFTIGSAVASSAATTITTPAADSLNTVVGSDFAIPVAGWYCLGFVQSTASIAASSHLFISAQLQMRNT